MTRSSIRIAPRPQMPTTDSNDNQGTSAPDLRDQRKRRRATLAEQEKRATAVKTEKERVFISYEQPKRSRGRPRKYPKATVGAEQTIVPSNPTRIAPAPIPPGTAGPSGPSGTSGTSSAPSPPSASSAPSAPSAPSMPLPPSTPTAVTYYSHTNYVPAPPPSSITGTAASAMRLETAASAPAPTPSPITVSAVSATRLEIAASAPAPTPSPITVSAASDTRLETAASAPAPPYPSSAHDAHQISEFDSFMQYKKLHTPCPPIKQDVDESLAPDNQHEKAANEVELVAIKPEPMAAPSPSYTKMSSKRKAAQRATPRPASIPSDTCVVWVAATHNVFIIYESSDLGKIRISLTYERRRLTPQISCVGRDPHFATSRPLDPDSRSVAMQTTDTISCSVSSRTRRTQQTYIGP
ncbi:hypothetical protein BCR43DRAFT_308105 [Syncephalastrum racemosum]|uniref:Uncharacterized protein n=1 Tax=Syncephalastrum racemosum TaxID=13706 RepID=A0A1X2HAF1_SYNRA|nr:hypothetical protein BCR43DRAFT_308105 [Syncephalastrum racemosum]